MLIIYPDFNLGFDLTDQGWQLAKSWGMMHGDFRNNVDLIWGSSFINGLWLNAQSHPLILWSRIGFLILIPCIGVLIFLILKEFFHKNYSFISIIIAFLFVSKIFLIYFYVNYYYLPVASSLLSFLFLTKSFKQRNNNYFHQSLSGIFAGITIHLKFTYILIIPVLITYVFLFCTKEHRFRTSFFLFSSVFVALIAGFGVLLAAGGASTLIYEHGRLSIFDMFGYFFGLSDANSSLNYSYKNLLSIYFKDLITVVNYTMIPLLIFISTSYLSLKYSKMKILLSIAGGVSLYFFIFYSYPESLKLIGSFLVIQAAMTIYFNNRSKETLFLNFIFISVFALSFLGSGTGFYGGLISLGFLGFVSMTICTTSTGISSDKFNTKIMFSVLIIAGSIAQFTKEKTPYCDLPSSYLNTEFRSPELSGIYSFKERVDVVDEFMDFAKSEQIDHDRVIFVGMPMLYYLLDINPVISETHDVILGFEQLKKEVIEANPNVIVMPVQSPRGRLWPLPQNADYWTSDGFERQTAHYYEFYREYMSINNFKKEFENAMFAVYRKSELLREVAE